MSQLIKGVIYVRKKEDIKPYESSPFKLNIFYSSDAIRRKEIKIRPEQKIKTHYQIWKSRSKRRQKMSNHFSENA